MKETYYYKYAVEVPGGYLRASGVVQDFGDAKLYRTKGQAKAAITMYRKWYTSAPGLSNNFKDILRAEHEGERSPCTIIRVKVALDPDSCILHDD